MRGAKYLTVLTCYICHIGADEVIKRGDGTEVPRC